MTTAHKTLGGSIVALVTPMQANGAIDEVSFHALIDWHIAQGTEGLVIVGTTGESPTVTPQEQAQLIALAVKQVAGRVPVIAGTGTNCTKTTVEATMRAEKAGADACLIVTPYYNKPMQEGLFQHFQCVAESVSIPQILYNAPYRTGCDLMPETVARLADLPNIVAIKEATGDLKRLSALQTVCGDKIDFYSGDDVTGCEFMLQGGHGVISVTGNVVPDLMAALCRFARAGDAEQARALDKQLMPLHRALFVESNPIPAKWALHAMGRIPEGLRLPLTTLSASHHTTLTQALQALNVLK